MDIILLALLSLALLYKLHSVLGEGEPTRSFYQTHKQKPFIKDVTPTTPENTNDIKYEEAEEEHKDVLKALQAHDPSFTLPKFLDGAKAAYSIIINAIVSEDLNTLKELLSTQMFNSVEAKINAYKKNDEQLIFDLIAFSNIIITDMQINSNVAGIAVKLELEEIIYLTKSNTDNIVAGTNKVKKTIKHLLFVKDVHDQSKRWYLNSMHQEYDHHEPIDEKLQFNK